MKYDRELIGYVNTFEALTKASVKDLFLDKNKNLVVIVKEGDAGKAIGKAGRNIKMLMRLLKRRIKIIEYSKDPVEFVKSAIDPIKVDDITVQDKVMLIQSRDTKIKALLIGRNQNNLKELDSLVNRFFDLKLRVV